MNEKPKTKSSWQVLRWVCLASGAVALFFAGSEVVFWFRPFIHQKSFYRFCDIVAIVFVGWMLMPLIRKMIGWLGILIAFTRRFFRRLFTWRIMRRLLVGLALFITLAAIFYTEENWRGKRAWENCKRELEAKGAVLDWNAYIPPPVPDDQNIFKAPKIKEWFQIKPPEFARPNTAILIKPATNELAGLSTNGMTTAVITNKTIAANYLAWSDQFESDFDLIREAVKRPYAQLDGDYQRPYANAIPNFIVVRSVSQALAQRANCYLLLGQPEKALHELTLLHDMGRLLEGGPTSRPMTLVAAMINVAVTGLYVNTIVGGFQSRAWQEPQLIALQAQLKEIDLSPPVVEAIDTGRASACRLLENTTANELGKMLWFGDAKPTLWTKITTPKYLLFTMAPRGWVYQNMIAIAISGQIKSAYFDLTNNLILTHQPREVVRQATFSQFSPLTFLAAMSIPNLVKVLQTVAYDQTLANEAQIVCALERYHLAHGEYPQTLDALAPQFIETIPHDIIGGQPLHYRRTDDGKFLLYSVGWNEADDGGLPGTLSDVKNGDWVWQYPVKY